MNRRTVLGLIGLGANLNPVGALSQEGPASEQPKPGDLLVRAKGDKSRPLVVADLVVGAGPIECWAMDPASGTIRNGIATNRLLLFRFDPSELGPGAAAYAADGVLALTIICTHAACEVTEWLEDEKLLQCPCHFSRFDPKNNGAVVQGPATRDLPALALAVSNGKLVVAKPFNSRVGGDA